MRDALSLVRQREPDLEVDGEMHADAALLPNLSDRAAPDSRLEGEQACLNLDSATIAFTLLKAGADGLPIGPLVLGMSRPAHVLVPSVTARGS